MEEDKDDKVLVWPDLVYTELICLVLATAGLIVWAIISKAPLEQPANPGYAPNPAKAPWYFLGLQEMLVYFDPWMAGVVYPGPDHRRPDARCRIIDTNPKGNGYYTLKERPFAIVTWLFGFLILWVVLIFFGTFLRGPNWSFFGPYEYWDPHKAEALNNVDVSNVWWNDILGRARPTRGQQPACPSCRTGSCASGSGFVLIGVVPGRAAGGPALHGLPPHVRAMGGIRYVHHGHPAAARWR